MKAVRLVLHGFVLFATNMAGLIGGMMVYRTLGVGAQLAIQVPVAVMVSVMAFLGWVLLLQKLPLPSLRLKQPAEYAIAAIGSVAWTPVIFIPLHALTQGYLTGPENVVALVLFQIPTNSIAILVASKVGAHPRIHGRGVTTPGQS